MRPLLVAAVLAACSADPEPPNEEPVFIIEIEVHALDHLVVTLGDVVVGDGVQETTSGVATFVFPSGEALEDFMDEALVAGGTEQRGVSLRSSCRPDGKVIATELQQLYVWREAMDCELVVHSATCDYTDGSTDRWGYKPCE